MLSDKQIKLIASRVIEEFLHGWKAEDIYDKDHGRTYRDTEYRIPAVIPSPDVLLAEISRRLEEVELGEPFFRGLHQEDITSASRFNTNLQDLTDDFTLLTQEIISQIYGISRHFTAAEYEFRKLSSVVRRLVFDSGILLEIASNPHGWQYGVGDNFTDLSSVDIVRSNVLINTKGGFTTIPDKDIKYISLDKYRDATIPDSFRVTTEHTSSSFLGTKFWDAVSDREDRYFLVTVSGVEGGAGIQFTISMDGAPDINLIRISGDSTYDATVEYRNAYTSKWEPIVTNHQIHADSNIVSNTSDLVHLGRDTKPGITDMRFTLRKDVYNRINGGLYEYDFMIRSINLYTSSHTGAATLYSKSLAFADWDGGDFTVNQVSLQADEYIPPNSYIDYYVAVDPYASGTFIDVSSNAVNEDSVDKVNFQYNLSYPGTSGVLYSTLRDTAFGTWENWKPSWMPITPLGRTDITANISGVLPPRILNFGNYHTTEAVVDGWISNTPTDNKYGIQNYTIRRFPAEPKDVELRQGKRTWIRTSEAYANERLVQVDATFAEDGETKTITIGPDVTVATGSVVSEGKVVLGSVRDVVRRGVNIDNPGNHFLLKDNLPDFLADIHVAYNTTNGRAILTKSTETVWGLRGPTGAMDATLRYAYYDVGTLDRFDTYVYVPDGAVPYIIFTNTGNINKLIIENIADGYEGNILMSGTDLDSEPRVLLLPGWNKVIVYTNSGVTWNPTNDVSMPAELEYYAYMEPLQRVGMNNLLYRTHRNDHTKYSIYPSGGWYYMSVNDPSATTTASGFVYYNKVLGTGILGSTIMATDSSMNAFYDLSYREVSRYVTNVMVKAEMGSVGEHGPILYDYKVMGGDTLR